MSIRVCPASIVVLCSPVSQPEPPADLAGFIPILRRPNLCSSAHHLLVCSQDTIIYHTNSCVYSLVYMHMCTDTQIHNNPIQNREEDAGMVLNGYQTSVELKRKATRKPKPLWARLRLHQAMQDLWHHLSASACGRESRTARFHATAA